jgi:hypothetical protein
MLILLSQSRPIGATLTLHLRTDPLEPHFFHVASRSMETKIEAKTFMARTQMTLFQRKWSWWITEGWWVSNLAFLWEEFNHGGVDGKVSAGPRAAILPFPVYGNSCFAFFISNEGAFEVHEMSDLLWCRRVWEVFFTKFAWQEQDWTVGAMNQRKHNSPKSHIEKSRFLIAALSK